MTVEWTRLEDCPGLGPDPVPAGTSDAKDRQVAMRQGSVCALMSAKGELTLCDSDGPLTAGMHVSGLGSPDRVYRSPALGVSSWDCPNGTIEQVVFLSSRPAAAIVQWRFVGTTPRSDGISVHVTGALTPPGEGPFRIGEDAPATFAVWRPPADDRRRSMLERVLRDPDALWRRWTTRRDSALRVGGFGPIADPVGFALAMLQGLEGERFWIGVREGMPVEGSSRDRALCSLALAAAGRFEEAAEVLPQTSGAPTVGAPPSARDFLPHWTGVGDATVDPGDDPLVNFHLESVLVAPALQARRSGDLALAEELWMDLMSTSSRRGGWTRPGWNEHAGEAAATVASFIYDFLGARPDAGLGRLRLAPTFPAGVDHLIVDGLKVGRAALRFDYRHTSGRTTFVLQPLAGSFPLNVVLEPLVPTGLVSRVEVDGELAEVGLESEGDRTRVRLQLPLETSREVVVHHG